MPGSPENDATMELQATADHVGAILAQLVSELDPGREHVEIAADCRLQADLGIYSLERVELLLRLEEAFGVALSEESVEATTVRDLITLVGGRAGPSRTQPGHAGVPERVPTKPSPSGGSIVFTAYAGLLLVGVSMVLWPLLQVLRGERAARLLHSGARFMLWATGCAPEVVGREHLDGVVPAVLVANHESYLDCVVMLGTLPIVPNILVNERLPGSPLIGTCVEAAGYLCVDRRSTRSRLACAEALVTALMRGESLLVFPEGTFTDEPGRLPFRLGAFSAAALTRRPVVPITLHGTRRILPGGAALLGRGRVSVTIHPPVYPTDGNWAEALRLRDTVRDVIHGGQQPCIR
jgi:acyl carrier protein